MPSEQVRIANADHLNEDFKHLLKVLQGNGYKKRDIVKAFKRAKSLEIKNHVKEMESKRKVILPYIKGTTDRIAKVLSRKKINTTFTPPNSLKNMLDKAKDPIVPKMRKSVYFIPYSCG